MAEAAKPAASGPLVLEERSGAILTLRLNRPDRLNALNVALGRALVEALQRAGADPEIRAVVLTGAGRAFCAGGDLGEIRGARDRGAAAELEPLLRAGMQVVLVMRSTPQPVIAAVNGPAAGAGMNVALACDIRIASEHAVFGQNFAKVGLFPDFGGTYLLPRIVGTARAAEMFFTGEMIDAREAERIGVVSQVVPHERLEEKTRMLAEKLAGAPPLAARAVKQALYAAEREELERALEFEVHTQTECFASEDCTEGLRAFFEKRKPVFRGR